MILWNTLICELTMQILKNYLDLYRLEIFCEQHELFYCFSEEIIVIQLM